MKSSIEIAQQSRIKPINEIAEQLGILDYIEPYGKYMAKISLSVLRKLNDKKEARLILVTAITPTPAGEGKTVISIGLSQALWKLSKKNIVCLRQPSMGPTFGIKGGGAGGGYTQLQPMQEINLHFTGDFHAVTAANNLLAAILDNHVFHGNELGIDVQQVAWKRAMDMNDRALRKVLVSADKIAREDAFEITSASEVMTTLCLAKDIQDLKSRLASLIVAYTAEGEAVRAADLRAHGAMGLLLKDAVKPNLVQTLENTPAIVHGGPFGNIAHGAPSVISMKLASKLTDYIVVEAGFGSDLGAEKFLHIVVPQTGLVPSVAVMVCSVRALKTHGGVPKENLTIKNLEALNKGLPNLEKHIANVRGFGIPVVVALNRMEADTNGEVKAVSKFCAKMGVPFAESRVFTLGGEGGIELAKKVISTMENSKPSYTPVYKTTDNIKTKVQKVAQTVYGAAKVEYTEIAEKAISKIEPDYHALPICFAKTQYSLSDDPKKLGRPRGFTLTVTNVKVSAGAGFVIVYAGDIMTMPGLPKSPVAERMDIDTEGRIYGLF